MEYFKSIVSAPVREPQAHEKMRPRQGALSYMRDMFP